MSPEQQQQRRTHREWKRAYAALRAADPEAFRKAIYYSEEISLNHRLPLNVAAAIEVSHVWFACELLGVQP